jgi:hypothetical protein
MEDVAPPGTTWRGSLITVNARTYDKDISIGLTGALSKGFDAVSHRSIEMAMERLGMLGRIEAFRLARKEAVMIKGGVTIKR